MILSKYLNFLKKIILANIKHLKRPYKIFLVVTKSCGSRCSNCLIWQEKPSNELSISEFELIATNLGPSLSWLNISGGEPTDRDNLIEIIKTFIQKCPNLLIINFTSNGLNHERLKKIAQVLSDSFSGIIGINISIVGIKKLAHFEIITMTCKPSLKLRMP